jgi:hypothetical protein
MVWKHEGVWLALVRSVFGAWRGFVQLRAPVTQATLERTREPFMTFIGASRVPPHEYLRTPAHAWWAGYEAVGSRPSVGAQRNYRNAAYCKQQMERLAARLGKGR